MSFACEESPMFITALFVLVAMAIIPYVTRSQKLQRASTPDHVFTAHWVEVYTNLLAFRRWGYLHKEPNTRVGRAEWLLAAFLSVCRLMSPMAYEVVDDFNFGGKRTQVWLVNFNIWHFIVPGGRRWILWKMKRTVRAAKRRGVRLNGLGALMKDRGLTNDGELFAELLGEDRPRLAHGDTITAMTVYLQSVQLLAQIGSTASILITGATSKIGRALAAMLARQGYTVLMHSEAESRVQEVKREVPAECAERLVFVKYITPGALKGCKLVITGKRTGGKELLASAAPGTVFLNFSVPDPFTPEMLEGKPFYHYDGGLLNYSQISNTLHFAMRLLAGSYTYACHAWLLTACVYGLTDDELGKVDTAKAEPYWKMAEAIGFRLPEPMSFLHPMGFPQIGAPPATYHTPKPVIRPRSRRQRAA